MAFRIGVLAGAGAIFCWVGGVEILSTQEGALKSLDRQIMTCVLPILCLGLLLFSRAATTLPFVAVSGVISGVVPGLIAIFLAKAIFCFGSRIKAAVLENL